MKILSIFKRTKTSETKRSFSDFFLHTSEQEKERVFIDAAQRANEDQRALLEQVRHKMAKTCGAYIFIL